MKRIFNRIFLFLSIVWRDYEGSPLDWSTSWAVAKSIHPTRKEERQREQEIREILDYINDVNDQNGWYDTKQKMDNHLMN